MKPAQVAAGEYGARIQRAEYLASKHTFAAEVLHFYARLAEFQKTFYAEIKRDIARQLASRPPRSLRGPMPSGDGDLLLARFQSFLSLIKQAAPPPLAAAAQQISELDAPSKLSLLDAYWDVGGTNDQLIGAFAQFVPRAVAQPLAELLAVRTAAPPVAADTQHSCPLCGGQPLLGVLRPEGDSGKRRMMCSFCLQEWDFRRIYCHACGEDDEKKLPVYVAEQFPHVRVEACDTCKVYLRTIDLTKDGHAVPLVDDLAAIPLSLWAQEHNYIRLQPNLLGT
jgi:FdhE protein